MPPSSPDHTPDVRPPSRNGGSSRDGRRHDGEIRVAIASDHALFREAVRSLIESQADLCLVGAGASQQTLDIVSEAGPDILLLDLAVQATAGLDVLKEIARTAPSTRTLLMSSEVSGPDILEALQRGARGVIMKDASTEQLFKSIRAVMAGQYWVSRELVAAVIDRMRERQRVSGVPAPGPAFGLTPREMEMVAAVVAGCSNREIAQQLSISAKTVKHHLTNIFEKLGLSNRLELALFAVQHRVGSGQFH
jgi:two-component system, NarL family, nitrate/nitrite response regulator NarL